MSKRIEDILNNFQSEIKGDIPSFFNTDNLKKEFYSACTPSLFLKNFIDYIPRKILYYSDFVKYVKNYLESIRAKDFDDFIDNKIRVVKTIRYGMGYPIYDFVQQSIYSFDDFHLYNQNFDKNERKKLIFQSHTPFFLYYIIKYWEDLPLPGNEIIFDSLKKGILPLYEKLNEYYMQAEQKDSVTTHYVVESVLGGRHFCYIVDEFFENADSNLQKMESGLKSNVLTALILIKYLPGEELKELFSKALKREVVDKFDVDSKYPLQETEKINKILLSFVEEMLMFIVKTQQVFPTYFMHSINKSIESNVIDSKRIIKEANIGMSVDILYNIRTYLAEMANINNVKNETVDTISKLKNIYEKKADVEISRFYRQYYGLTNPYISIYNMCSAYACTYQTACEKYAREMLK